MKGILAGGLLVMMAGVSLAVEVPTVATGRQLFESPVLGSSGKSCATCHPGGKGLEEISAYSDTQLREMINFCIRDALQGKMLADGTQELDSILLYLRSLPGK